MAAVRDEYADSERNPSEPVNHKKNCGEFYEMNVSTLADEYGGDGWVQRTRPYSSDGSANPIEVSGSAGALKNENVKERKTPSASDHPATSGYNQDQ